MAKKINIAIICGGPSNEREVSLKTGQQIAKALPGDKYNTYFIEISKKGKWLLSEKNQKGFLKDNGKLEDQSSKSIIVLDQKKKDIIKKEKAKDIDIAFIALHGKFGEDGRIQSILELLEIPYTGSGVLASALGMNKIKTYFFLKKFGIRCPKFFVVNSPKEKTANVDKKIIKLFKYPCVVKPNESGSSIGISIVNSKKELKNAIEKAFNEDKTVLVEEYVRGRELTCGVIGNTGQTKLIALPVVEIISHSTFFDYNAKYLSSETEEICPANIDKKTAKKVKQVAKQIHSIIGADGLTRSDFILKDGELFFLEINTIPGLTEQSLCPKEARAAGMSFQEFIEKQIKLGLLKFSKQQ